MDSQYGTSTDTNHQKKACIQSRPSATLRMRSRSEPRSRGQGPALIRRIASDEVPSARGEYQGPHVASVWRGKARGNSRRGRVFGSFPVLRDAEEPPPGLVHLDEDAASALITSSRTCDDGKPRFREQDHRSRRLASTLVSLRYQRKS
jgi:hypothetical protein